jgi:ubiquinone/menaquinone biosynthesis C-methylase UbiE
VETIVSDPVRTTRATYDRVATDFLANTRDRSHGARQLDGFASRLEPGATVLDLGAGPGCDSAELRARRLRPVGVDLSMGMLRAGSRELPGPRVQGDLRALPFADASADGIWANACLLHLVPDDLVLAVREISRVSRPGAVVHLSVKKGKGAGWETERYGRPRWFQYWSAAALDSVLTGAGWSILDSLEQATRRDEWLVRLASTARAASHHSVTMAAEAGDPCDGPSAISRPSPNSSPKG